MEIEGFSDVTAILRCGVYILVHHGRVVYVGQSKTMLNRLYQHRTLWGSRTRKKVGDYVPIKGVPYDEVLVRPCAVEKLDALERELIDRYRPQYNIKHKHVEKVQTPITFVVSGTPIAMIANLPKDQGLRRRA